VQSDLDRFLALVRRELGAEEARVLEPEREMLDDPCELRCRMADGRGIGARFGAPPPDHDAKQRRLEMLVSTFDGVIAEASQRPRSRPPIVHSLRDELEAVCTRAAALNVIVIDAKSPVVWGAAQPQGVIPIARRTSGPPADGVRDYEPEPRVAVVSRRALHAVRRLPELAALRKGKHLRHVERAREATPLVAHSFAGIYVIVVVFDAPFDELRAERAILEALPRIERLVLALPPLDPVPQGGVIALRRRRRG
jgi:hypothetical protein